MPSFGAKTMTTLIKEVEENVTLDALDVTSNASVRMKPLDFMNQLEAPLIKHTGIQKLVLRECEMDDGCCEVLARILAGNSVIEEVDLQKNKITSVGALALATSLKQNKGVKTLDLTGQAVNSFGEETLEQFLAVFQTNITLTKIIWRLESRKASSLATAMTRNVEIAKRKANGKPFDDLLPDGLRAGRRPSEVPVPAAAGAPAAADEAKEEAAAQPEEAAPKAEDAAPAAGEES